MAEKVIKEKKAAAPKAPKAAKPKAAPKPQMSKEELSAAVQVAIENAMTKLKAAEEKQEVFVPEAPKEVKKIKCTSDERLMHSLAWIYLVIGLISSVALLITGIVLEATEDSFLAQYLDGPDMGLICIVLGVVLLLPTLVSFAFMRLFANISHRLTSLDKK
jgi:hypothetical protein